MKKRRILITLGFIILLAGFIFYPVLFPEKERGPLSGPSLADLSYAEIGFQNGDLQLGGIVLTPDGDGPFPVVVVIHGSGTSKRESKWYLTVSEHLASNGIAVVLPDKRGSEKSEGEWRGASFEDLAGDTLAAVRYVINQDDFEYDEIGLLGMSQGGWIAPLAATESSDISFVISMSGAGVSTDEQLYFEEVNSIADMGVNPLIASLIARLTVKNIERMDFWTPIAGFDPSRYWSKVEVRAFAAFGGGDKNVPVEQSIQRMTSANESIVTKVYPQGGHGITDPATGVVQIEYLSDLVDFIKLKTIR